MADTTNYLRADSIDDPVTVGGDTYERLTRWNSPAAQMREPYTYEMYTEVECLRLIGRGRKAIVLRHPETNDIAVYVTERKGGRP